MLTITRGRFEQFIRRFGRPAERDGLPDQSGPPTPEQAAALAQACREFGIELVGPPLSRSPNAHYVPLKRRTVPEPVRCH